MNPFKAIQSFLDSALRDLAQVFEPLGGHKWAVAIIVFTILLRVLLLPLTIKQTRSQLAMQRIKPQMDEISKKFKGDRTKAGAAQQELFQREGVNPLGCIGPMIVQMPILFAMYGTMQALIKGTQVKGVVIVEAIDKMPFFGLGNLAKNAISSPAGIILIAIMTLSSVYSARLLSGGMTAEQKRQNLIMQLIFPVIFLQSYAAIVLYWTVSNVFQYFQQRIMISKARKDPVMAAALSYVPEPRTREPFQRGAGRQGAKAAPAKSNKPGAGQRIPGRSANGLSAGQSVPVQPESVPLTSGQRSSLAGTKNRNAKRKKR